MPWAMLAMSVVSESGKTMIPGMIVLPMPFDDEDHNPVREKAESGRINMPIDYLR